MSGPFKALISFHYFRTTDVGELLDVLGPDTMLFGDSGAFSAATQGADVNLDDYAAWLHRWRDRFIVYSNLDVIGDDEASRRNQRELERRGLHPLPVFHAGSDFRTLESYCEEYPYIALGGMVGKPNLGPWLVRCFEIAVKHGAVFHGFGQTRHQFLLDFPFYSVDSSSWSGGVRFGLVHLWDDRRARFVKVTLANHAEVYRHAELIRDHGCDPAKLASREGFERRELVRTNGMAWLRYNEFLRRRHGPIRLRDDSRPAGLHLHLAEGNETNLRRAGGLHLYLADTTVNNFRPMAPKEHQPA